MKNKKVTYILLVISIGLWGFIGWKVFSAFNYSQPEAPTVKKEKEVVEKDSVFLLLNYRDPFLGKYSSRVILKDTVPPRKRVVNVISPPKQEPELPIIQYKGTMNVGKIALVILQKNGNVYTIKVGEEVDGFKLIKMDDYKITLSNGKKKYEIPIQ